MVRWDTDLRAKGRWWKRRPKTLSWRVLLSLGVAAGLLLLGDAEPSGAETAPEKAKRVRQLQSIGRKVAQAILARDIELLLRFDRPDEVEDSRRLLRDKKSNLYCYLFDSSCMGGGRSVYDILRNARRLAITVMDIGRGKDGIQHAIIFFYDGATIPKQKLRSPEFLCEKSLQEITSWTFKYVNGRWESASPLFGAETGVLCEPDV